MKDMHGGGKKASGQSNPGRITVSKHPVGQKDSLWTRPVDENTGGTKKSITEN